MHGHLEARTIKTPDINKVTGTAREQITRAVTLARFLVKQQEPVKHVLAHTIGNTCCDIAREHPQLVAEESKRNGQADQPQGIHGQGSQAEALSEGIYPPAQPGGAKGASAGAGQRKERTNEQFPPVGPHIGQ